jgi:hypothetical protein
VARLSLVKLNPLVYHVPLGAALSKYTGDRLTALVNIGSAPAPKIIPAPHGTKARQVPLLQI